MWAEIYKIPPFSLHRANDFGHVDTALFDAGSVNAVVHQVLDALGLEGIQHGAGGDAPGPIVDLGGG